MNRNSQWYINEAIKKLQEAAEGNRFNKRGKVLKALRHLISYVSGKRGPDTSFSGYSDEPVCDRCFIKLRSRDKRINLVEKEMCKECRHQTSANSKSKKSRIRMTMGDHVKVDSSGKAQIAALSDHPERADRIKKHTRRVREQIKRLGLERDRTHEE